MSNATSATNNVWQQKAETFWPSNTSLDTKVLPPAIYRFVPTQVGWYLEKSSSRYVFPYKIYGTNDEIIDRIKNAWKGLSSNFGVLLNGLKGTGKTITAQMIANWAIDSGYPVLNVSDPVPLPKIMEKIEQPLLVLFDEFEKTHDENTNPGCQQQLLTAIDGLARNDHRRLFLFTTNTKNVNSNFLDRPSRIRYCWEFDRLDDEIIEMLLDDMLNPEIAHFRSDIISYLHTRDVLTIDVAKTVIAECNIFREAPEGFKEFMNLSEKEPNGFKLEIVGPDGDLQLVSPYFKPPGSTSWLQSLFTRSGRRDFINTWCVKGSKQRLSDSGRMIEIIEPTEKMDEWVCHVQISSYQTWVGTKLGKMVHSYLWLDEKPKGWRIPEWAKKFEAGKDVADDEQDEFDEWLDSGSIFGSKRARLRIRFTPNKTTFTQYSYALS